MAFTKKLHLICAVIFLFVTILFAQAGAWYDSPGPSPSFSPPPLPDSRGASGKSIDAFKNEKPTRFDYDSSQMKDLQFESCGKAYRIKGYELEPGQVLIPTGSKQVKDILANFNAYATYNKYNGIITIVREKTLKFRMKLNYGTADYMGRKIDIPVPPRIINGKPYISPSSIAKFIWCTNLYNKERGIYYLDSWVLDIDLETSRRGKTDLVARGTGKLNYRILKLQNPTRFVIDVLNACLDGNAGSLDHPTLGKIRYSQFELMGNEGNIVRIVVPQSEDMEIVMQKARAVNYVEANLRPREVSAPLDLPVQKISGIKVDENDSRVVIIMTTTGPLQLEWNRLLEPDNRFFIDIPDMVYPEGKKDIKIDSKFLPELKIAQFAPKPKPIVRMVLPLEGSNRVELDTDKNRPNQIKITVHKETVDVSKSTRKGFLVTSMPATAKGLVICLDPGHGGSDPGAVNRKIGLMEKDVTIDISRRLKALLKAEGWTVAMTRDSDRDVSYAGSPDYEELGARTRIPNDLKADVFVSIHINASIRPSVAGVATYWYKTQDKLLASSIQTALSGKTGRPNLGARRERFYLLRASKMPSALVEVCFISNPTEANLLASPAFRQKSAEAIMEGLRNYAHQANLKSKAKKWHRKK